MRTLTDRPPIPCEAWECPACWEWHSTEASAGKCCNGGKCNCPHCDRCEKPPVKQQAIRCPDCGALDDTTTGAIADMVARKCCSPVPMAWQARTAL